MRALIAMLGSLLPFTAGAAELRYREEVDGKTQYTQVCRRENATVVQYPDDRYEIRADAAGNAREVVLTRGGSGKTLTVTRAGEQLQLGASERQPLEGLGWHQSPFALDGFVRSGETERTFWVISASSEANDGRQTASAMKLVARREGVEKTPVNGRAQEAVHVLLTLPGFRSLFWKAHYWFRADGTLLRYEEPRGKKGFVRGVLVEERP